MLTDVIESFMMWFWIDLLQTLAINMRYHQLTEDNYLHSYQNAGTTMILYLYLWVLIVKWLIKQTTKGHLTTCGDESFYFICIIQHWTDRCKRMYHYNPRIYQTLSVRQISSYPKYYHIPLRVLLSVLIFKRYIPFIPFKMLDALL